MTKPLPKKLLERLASFLSSTDFESVISAYSSDRNASFRVNPVKSNEQEVSSVLKARGVRFERLEALPGAYVVPKEDEYSLKGTDLFYGGKIYVQGLSSQIPVRFLETEPGLRILDVCAAPGSKTTQIAAEMSGEGELVAVEKSSIRMDKLMHNVRLQGLEDVVTPVKADALDYLLDEASGTFDRILLDAPCSAEGRIRASEEKSFGFWTMENVRSKAAIQSGLLQSSLKVLAPGGVLVYATCTLAPEENEGVVTDALAAFADVELVECRTGLVEDRPGISSFEGKTYAPGIEKTLRLLPSARMEGFFIAKFRKKG